MTVIHADMYMNGSSATLTTLKGYRPFAEGRGNRLGKVLIEGVRKRVVGKTYIA